MKVNKISEFLGHTDAIYTLHRSWQEGHFLSAGADGVVAEWNIISTDAKAIAQTSASVYSICIVPSRKLLILGLRNGGLQFVDYEKRITIKSVTAHKKGVFDLLLYPDERQLLASSEDGSLSLWDLDQLELDRKIQLSQKSIRTVSFSPDFQHIIIGSSDNHLYLLQSDLTPVHKWTASSLSVFRAVFDPETGMLYSGGRDAQIHIWDPKQNFKEVATLQAHLYAINDLIPDPTLPYFYSGSMDKSIKIWSKLDFELIKVINFEKNGCHKNGVNRLLFTDGSLFSCGDDRKIIRWDFSPVKS